MCVTAQGGVYSTQPGFVGGVDDDANLMAKVPLAIVGVVPTKASAENGVIFPGDLLATSSTPGHAMLAGPNPPQGTVLGKALAIDSDNYRLDWFTPLTGGGGPASSTHYAVNFTVGQTASGASTSTNYQGCLGYWCGEVEYQTFLPLVLRNYH